MAVVIIVSYSQFSVDEVLLTRLQMCELEKNDKDMLLLGKLQVCMHDSGTVSHARKTTATRRQRVTFKFAYDHRSVCKTTFCFLHGVGEKIIKKSSKALKKELSLAYISRSPFHSCVLAILDAWLMEILA